MKVTTKRAMEQVGLEPCREHPPCGTPVYDRSEHRRWHKRVFIEAEKTERPERPAGPRYVGADDEDDSAD